MFKERSFCYFARVIQNYDEKFPNLVKVQAIPFPALNSSSDGDVSEEKGQVWLPYMTNVVGTDKDIEGGYGFHSLPEIGSIVIVLAIDDGDANSAQHIILGNFWDPSISVPVLDDIPDLPDSLKDYKTSQLSKENPDEITFLKSKSGTTVLFDDKNGRFCIYNPRTRFYFIIGPNGEIDINSPGPVVTDGGKLQINTNNFSINVKGKGQIVSDKGLLLSSKNKLDIISRDLNLNGKNINLNGKGKEPGWDPDELRIVKKVNHNIKSSSDPGKDIEEAVEKLMEIWGQVFSCKLYANDANGKMCEFYRARVLVGEQFSFESNWKNFPVVHAKDGRFFTPFGFHVDCLSHEQSVKEAKEQNKKEPKLPPTEKISADIDCRDDAEGEKSTVKLQDVLGPKCLGEVCGDVEVKVLYKKGITVSFHVLSETGEEIFIGTHDYSETDSESFKLEDVGDRLNKNSKEMIVSIKEGQGDDVQILNYMSTGVWQFANERREILLNANAEDPVGKEYTFDDIPSSNGKAFLVYKQVEVVNVTVKKIDFTFQPDDACKCPTEFLGKTFKIPKGWSLSTAIDKNPDLKEFLICPKEDACYNKGKFNSEKPKDLLDDSTFKDVDFLNNEDYGINAVVGNFILSPIPAGQKEPLNAYLALCTLQEGKSYPYNEYGDYVKVEGEYPSQKYEDCSDIFKSFGDTFDEFSYNDPIQDGDIVVYGVYRHIDLYPIVYMVPQLKEQNVVTSSGKEEKREVIVAEKKGNSENSTLMNSLYAKKKDFFIGRVIAIMFITLDRLEDTSFKLPSIPKISVLEQYEQNSEGKFIKNCFYKHKGWTKIAFGVSKENVMDCNILASLAASGVFDLPKPNKAKGGSAEIVAEADAGADGGDDNKNNVPSQFSYRLKKEDFPEFRDENNRQSFALSGIIFYATYYMTIVNVEVSQPTGFTLAWENYKEEDYYEVTKQVNDLCPPNELKKEIAEDRVEVAYDEPPSDEIKDNEIKSNEIDSVSDLPGHGARDGDVEDLKNPDFLKSQAVDIASRNKKKAEFGKYEYPKGYVDNEDDTVRYKEQTSMLVDPRVRADGVPTGYFHTGSRWMFKPAPMTPDTLAMDPIGGKKQEDDPSKEK